jgi:hypothetical protein
MKSILKTILISLFVMGMGSTAFAVTTGGDNGGASNNVVNTVPYTGATLTNPLAGGDINDIPTLVARLLTIIVTIGVPLIALAIIYAGFKFVTAQGNPEKLEEAKKNLLWIIVGAAILLSAYAIAQGIEATISDIRGN